MSTILTNEQKEMIRENLNTYKASYGSQNKAAAALNVAPATLSAISNGDFSKISDEMWRNIASQVGGLTLSSTQHSLVRTTASDDLIFCMDECRTSCGFVWAISPAGSGKTAAAKFVARQSNTYYILCDEDMRKGDFARELARACGLKTPAGLNARGVVQSVVQHLRERSGVLLIIDEADKLPDTVLHYFISIYNYLEDLSGQQTVGVQFLSTGGYIRTRLGYGLQYKRKGYHELWSRLGSKFYEVDSNTALDVEGMCRAKGIVSMKDIDAVVREADAVDFDLRRVMRKISALLRKNKQQS